MCTDSGCNSPFAWKLTWNYFTFFILVGITLTLLYWAWKNKHMHYWWKIRKQKDAFFFFFAIFHYNDEFWWEKMRLQIKCSPMRRHFPSVFIRIFDNLVCISDSYFSNCIKYVLNLSAWLKKKKESTKFAVSTLHRLLSPAGCEMSI